MDTEETPIFTEINGQSVKRVSGVEKTCRFYATQDENEKILCLCGSDSFRLNYGWYEIRATCPQCGYSMVVYDG